MEPLPGLICIGFDKNKKPRKKRGFVPGTGIEPALHC